jgi:hypothetical protein
MPTRLKRDNKGCYAQWGSGKKYRYSCRNQVSRERAINKANKQGQAIKISQSKR